MTPFVADPDFTLYAGDALDVLRLLESESVHCCVTSPPYWGLRDYGMDGQLGLEATPEEYVARMVAVFAEVRRVLRLDGTLWLNIGDSYNANGREGHGTRIGTKQGTNRASAIGIDANRPTDPTLKPKDMVGIPWRLAFALQADGWYLRSDIIWSKPNPMPESVTDRPTKAHEYLFLLTRSPRYFYDADAIREPLAAKTYTTFGTKHRAQGNDPLGMVKSDNWGKSLDERKPKLNADGEIAGANKRTVWTIPQETLGDLPAEAPRGPDGRRQTRVEGREGSAQHRSGERWPDPDGRNARSVWEIATESYEEAHFATFPQALVEPCIKAGCPVGGIVLDPFLGSGTTALVARRLGRKSVGIELSPEYARLAAKRLNQLSLLAEPAA